MRYLAGDEERDAVAFFLEAARIAEGSCCHRWKCGAVVVSEGTIIGKGHNSPPGDIPLEKCRKDDLPKNFKSDKTCCIHAEHRAIHDALLHHAHKIRGSRLYFMRIDTDGKLTRAGQPYCTICSKMTLDAGVGEFVLWHDEGICVYDTKEYNEISFQTSQDL